MVAVVPGLLLVLLGFVILVDVMPRWLPYPRDSLREASMMA